MRQVLILGLAALGLAATALAADVVLRDGTVITAKSYTINGSYVMVTMPDGRKVAYDVADVDVEAMRKAEKAAAPAAEAGTTSPPAPSNPFAKATAAGKGEAAMKITDSDVTHVRGTGEAAAGEEEGKGGQGPPKGYNEGGQVVIQGLDIGQAKPGVWRVQGEVVNRLTKPVMDVKVSMETMPEKGEPVKAEAALGTLAPGQSARFLHDFQSRTRPQVRLRTYWLQVGTPEAGGQAGRQGKTPAGAQQGSGQGSQQGAGSEAPRAMQWGGGGYQRGQAAGPTPTPTW